MSNCLCLKCKAFKNCELLKELKQKDQQIKGIIKQLTLDIRTEGKKEQTPHRKGVIRALSYCRNLLKKEVKE